MERPLALLLASALGLGALGAALSRPSLASLGRAEAQVAASLRSPPAAGPGAEAPRPHRPGSPVFVRIFKREAILEVWADDGARFRLAGSYPICAFSGVLGPKLREGDRQAPEGFYEVTREQLNPQSRYHLAFNLGFPNAYDQAHGRTGSFLMVHGDCVSVGCYAMTDEGIDAIYGAVDDALRGGQQAVPVHIFPFRMSDAAMAEARGSRWADFWQNLREGHDLFERQGRPPRVLVRDGRYAFAAR